MVIQLRRLFVVLVMLVSILLVCTYLCTTVSSNAPKYSPQSNAYPDFWLKYQLNELRKLNPPTPEELTDNFLEEWSKNENNWCERGSHRPECQVTCTYRNRSLIDIPTEHLRHLIIIPYRKRAENLNELLPRIYKMLMDQQVCFLIVIAEQDGEGVFNKGALMNGAFIEALDYFPFHCVTLHDVDLIPLDDRISYRCSTFPRHNSVNVDTLKGRLPYVELIGGVLMMPVKMFLRVNGYSNFYWGWGGEDDDMYARLIASEIPITRADLNVARFHMLSHKTSFVLKSNWRFRALQNCQQRLRLDGLNTVNFSTVLRESYSTWTTRSKQPAANLPVSNTSMTILHFLIDVGVIPKFLQPAAS